MKTAMQEMIEEFEIIKTTKCKTLQEMIFFDGILAIIESKYLEKERKQHETTFHRGINIGAFNPELDIEGRKESAKHYYESTFVQLNNQNKLI